MDTTTDEFSSGTDYLSRDRYGMYASRDGDAAAAGGRGDGPGPRLMGADTLIGNDVYNRADEDLGDIKEIMLDLQSGRVAYAVLSFGGFLGMGEKLFAVPWQALTLDTANHRFTLDVDRDRLKDAPGFDPDRWPDMADESWARGVHAFYGTTAEGGSSRGDDAADVDTAGSRRGTGLDPLQPNDRVPTNRSGLTPDSIPVD